MVAPSTLALFALAAGALIVTPGPAVLFIVARSVHQGRRAGLLSALGVATGGLVHVAGAVLGFSALIASSAVAFGAVRWFGAAYLVYLGVKTLLTQSEDAVVEVPPPAPPRRLLAQGFVVAVLNPKTALFFLAFLPQFVDPGRGRVPLQMLVLGSTFLGLAIVSDASYALLAGSLAARLGRTALARRRARLFTGGVYVALGVGTALAGSRSRAAP
jgi:threonine/homoserine/homoserine lactone efflux protein